MDAEAAEWRDAVRQIALELCFAVPPAEGGAQPVRNGHGRTLAAAPPPTDPVSRRPGPRARAGASRSPCCAQGCVAAVTSPQTLAARAVHRRRSGSPACDRGPPPPVSPPCLLRVVTAHHARIHPITRLPGPPERCRGPRISAVPGRCAACGRTPVRGLTRASCAGAACIWPRTRRRGLRLTRGPLQAGWKRARPSTPRAVRCSRLFGPQCGP